MRGRRFRLRRRRAPAGGMPQGLVTLDRLPLGACGVIQSIDGERRLRRRLMEMGLLEGSRLRVVKFAPSGDPIEVKINDYFLSLRLSDAAKIVVDMGNHESDKESDSKDSPSEA